jgi:dienelactone hydrolase
MMLPHHGLAVLALATLLAAQNTATETLPQATADEVVTAVQPIGWRTQRFPRGGSKDGSLAAVVCYPSKVAAEDEHNAQLAPRKGGYPVIVFMHGLGGSGSQMLGVGRHFARNGYIAVLTDTTRFNRSLQARNGAAFFSCLKLCNADEDSFLHGQLDTERVGIGGHSMGGGNSMRVLGENPGYKAGFCFAPWTTGRGLEKKSYVDMYASTIKVPLGIVHGVKDRVLPWKKNAMRLFEATQKDATMKVLWVLDDTASHINIAIQRNRRPADVAVFKLCLKTATAFFDRHLKGQANALDGMLDPKSKPAGVLHLHINKTAPLPTPKRSGLQPCKRALVPGDRVFAHFGLGQALTIGAF